MEIDDDGSSDRGHSSRKKRPHPASVTAPKVKSSLEILQLVEHPNFEELSRWNPVFARAWEVTRQQQRETQKTFSACVSQEFTMALTRALLKTYLDLQLPYLETNHLCPPVPNRFFYLHWIHSDLLPQHGPRIPLFGMDIGSGATAIYSLLGAKFFNCHMFTTEIDPAAASMAHQNVVANQLEARIHVTAVAPSHSQENVLQQQQQHHHQAPGGPLERSLAAMEQFLHRQQQFPSNATLDFVMTNPPFYDPNSMDLITNPRAGDGRARTAMTVSEGSYPGGEVGFVTEMIADSLLRGRQRSARWFSSMLGKKTSLLHLQKLLTHVLGPAHVRVTDYGPGHYTRWFLAWTLEQPQATAPMACGMDQTFRVALAPSAVATTMATTAQDPVQEIVSRISTYCQSSPGGWRLVVSSSPSNVVTSTSGGGTILLTIHEALPIPPIASYVDESEETTADQLHIPEIVMQALQASGSDHTHFLPREGHFMVQISIRPVVPVTATLVPFEYQVKVMGYRHSSRGHAALKKIGSTLEGEICRTNRSWRRKLKGGQ